MVMIMELLGKRENPSLLIRLELTPKIESFPSCLGAVYILSIGKQSIVT